MFKLTAAAELFTEEIISSQAISAKSTKKSAITLNLITSFKKSILQLVTDIMMSTNKTLMKKTTVRSLFTEFTSLLSLLFSVFNSEQITEKKNEKESELTQMSEKNDTVNAELVTKLEECI